MQVVVVTPEKTAIDENAQSVTLPLYDGQIGILDNHAPMIGRLGFGELELTVGGSKQQYYVDGGFVQVADNVVSVLTGRAIPISERRGEPSNLSTETRNEIRFGSPFHNVDGQMFQHSHRKKRNDIQDQTKRSAVGAQIASVFGRRFQTNQNRL